MAWAYSSVGAWGRGIHVGYMRAWDTAGAKGYSLSI